ncbi:MAG: GPW/gp25 family protein [Chloroflexi bacterium]|nr:GPW/gp25 family protein [Chloroflexota bacterium]
MRQLIHDPNNEALRAIVQHQIAKSVGQWEPRVALQEVVVTQTEATLIIRLNYVLRQTGQPQSLSVPIGLGGL